MTSAVSPAKSRSVIIGSLCCVTFFLFNLKPMFSVSLPIACLMAYPNIIVKMYGARVSPCKIRANNSNSFVSQSGDKTFSFVSSYNSSIGLIIELAQIIL